MKRERADDIDELRLGVGEALDLESLRAAVVPPHLMVEAFVETPEVIAVEGEDGLDEDGVHGSVFHLRGNRPGHGELVVGFRDMQTQAVTHRKAISVAVDG